MKITQTNSRTNSMLKKINRTDMKNGIGMENVELK